VPLAELYLAIGILVSGADLDTDSIRCHRLRRRRREGNAVGAPDWRQERRHFAAVSRPRIDEKLHTLGDSDDASTASLPVSDAFHISHARGPSHASNAKAKDLVAR
jgi:hypothetical protein